MRQKERYIIEFKGNRKEVFSNPQNINLRIGDFVVVKTDEGENIGKIKQIGNLGERPNQWIIRKATDEDLKTLKELRIKEKEAFKICKDKIKEYNLEMKLVDVEYQFDGSKIYFFFKAKKRIGLKKLVKDLASIYNTKIQMCQLGARDEARRIGGCGPCGREFCCNMFLSDLKSVSSQMARDQNLAPNSSKILGACGRLMCCLLFEEDFYKEICGKFPQIGTKVSTKEGNFTVSSVDIFHETITLKDEDGNQRKISLEDFDFNKEKENAKG